MLSGFFKSERSQVYRSHLACKIKREEGRKKKNKGGKRDT